MANAKHKGIQIEYDDVGTGEPVLLFMGGWCANRTVFRNLLEPCSGHRRVLALDWRGHGGSSQFGQDFGEQDLVEDALSVIEASGARMIVPVALAHSGWVAIDLKHRLGSQIPKIIHVEWIIGPASLPFLKTLEAMQSPEHSRAAVESLFDLWLEGMEIPELVQFVRKEMGAYGFDMWARAGREIKSSYDRQGSPLQALSRIESHSPVLHLYAQPDDPGYKAMQEVFACENPWFHVHKLNARSHFPMFEVPQEMAEAIEKFVSLSIEAKSPK
jgi:pimeloyl-ACP methyl ester carboxylesterase